MAIGGFGGQSFGEAPFGVIGETIVVSVVDALTPAVTELDVQLLLKLLRDTLSKVLLRSRFVNDVHIGISDANVHIGNAPITVTKRD